MKESSVSAFVRLARWIACAAVALTLGAGTLLAQATGKIEGRVRDQAGAPIASAQVRINGTAFGAVANAQGYYFINNVPSGVYELVGTFVGYKPVGVAGLRVAAGQTITQDFTLEQTPIEITEITVVGAQNALVPRDQVTTKVTVFLEVEGAAHYLPAYAGNLDIMTSAALRTAEEIARRNAR